MAVDEAVATATAGAWVDQAAAGSATATGNATTTAASAWSGFTGWYSTAAVAAQAGVVSQTSTAAQDAITSMLARYIAELVAMLSGSPRVNVPRVQLQPVRNGADPLRVHARPAYVFRETFALTGDEFEAQRQAIERSIQIMETDIMLAARQAQMDAMTELKVTSYRRVLRPELSESGPCGLCVVAADKIYKVSELLPIHGRCKCETMPIVGGIDPGINLNREDLKRLYAAAGDSTKAADLKRTRVQINEHGELGPVLSLRGQRFTGPDDLGAPELAMVRNRLDTLNTILFEFTKRDSAGEHLAEPIAFQKRLIETAERRLATV